MLNKRYISIFLYLLVFLNLSLEESSADIETRYEKKNTFVIGISSPCLYLRTKNYLSKSNLFKNTALKVGLDISSTSVNTNVSKYDVDIAYIWGYSIGILQHFGNKVKVNVLSGVGRNIRIPNTDTYIAEDYYQYHYGYLSTLFSYYFFKYLKINLGMNFCMTSLNTLGNRFFVEPYHPQRKDFIVGIKSNLHKNINLEINYFLLFEKLISYGREDIKTIYYYLYFHTKYHFNDYFGIDIETNFPLRKEWKNENLYFAIGLVLKY